MTPERIAELRKLCEAATPGPWKWRSGLFHAKRDEYNDLDMQLCSHPELNHVALGESAMPTCKPNFDFTAAARTALPELLDEVERLEAEIAQLKSSMTPTRTVRPEFSIDLEENQ